MDPADETMCDVYKRVFRAEVLKECLGQIAGEAFWLETKAGKKLSRKAGILANELLDPKYDTYESLDEAEEKFHEYQKELDRLKGED